MTYTDSFLVEKLREILLRLYPSNPSPNTSHIAPGNGLKLSLQESFFDPNSKKYEELDILQNDIRSERVISGIGSSVVNKQGHQGDIGIIHNFTATQEEYDESFIVGNFSFAPQNESQSTSNNSVLVRMRQNDLYDTNALTRNLQDFIQILKMSLNGADSSGTSGSGLTFEGFENHQKFNNGGNNGMNNEPLSGLTVTNSADMEFNLTLDDIADLNNLLNDGSSGTSLPFKHFLIIFSYVLIGCVSIVGNLLVVQLVIRSRRLHTLTHALLANLAVADLCMATLNIPFSAARVILSEWPFGSVLCHAVPFVQVTSVYVTSITMAVIAIDRYSVIMNPLGRRMKNSQGIFLVLAIWILSGVLSIPYAIHHKVMTILTVRVVRRCQADFGSMTSRRWLTVATFLFQYLIPLAFTATSYFAIMQRLRNRSSALGSTTPRQVAAQSRAKKKTIKMLVITVVFFAISWAPINIYHLLTHFSLVRHDSTAILICHLIAMSSCTVNPFIYCWFNEHFRREALKWARCFRTRRCPIVHPAVEINGMLTRADRICHRAQSTTLIHTGSIRRSPQLSHSQQFRGTQQTPEHLRVSSSTSRLTSSFNPTRNLSSTHGKVKDLTSPVGYRPESLFLAKRTSLDDIFVDDAEYGKVNECKVDDNRNVGNSFSSDTDEQSNTIFKDENLDEDSEDYLEKPTVLNTHEGVSVQRDFESCKMGTFGHGILYGSSEEDSSEHV